MRKRRWLWAGSACSLAALATGLALTANGQDAPSPAPAPSSAGPAPAAPPPPVAEPKYYQGKTSPPPPGLFRATTTQPPAGAPGVPKSLPFGQTPSAFGQGTPNAQRPPITYANNPVPNLSAPPGQSVQQAGGFPRLTQPVVAGPTGVRPVGAQEPPAAPPFFVPRTPPINANPDAPEPKPLTPHVAVPAPVMPTSPIPAPMMPPVAVPAPVMPVVDQPLSVPPSAVPGVAPMQTMSPPPAVFIEPSQPAAAAPSPLPTTLTTTQGPLPSRTAPSLVLEAILPESIGVGQTLTYELVVRNVGSTPVANVRVEDELPAKCRFLGAEPNAESTGDRLAWNFGTLEAGSEKRIKINVKPSEEGDLRSRATVTCAASMEARTRVTRPKIALAMTAPESARVGEKVPFQIRLSNSGTGTAGKIQLRAEFSDGLNHAQGQVIEAELMALPAGQTKTLNLDALAGKAGKQLCKLTAVADGVQTEATNATVQLVEPLLTIKQSGPTKCLVKSEPTFVIELANPGTAATDPIQLWASLPAGLEFVQATEGGTFLEANRAIGWRLPALAAGTTKSVSIKLRATAPSEGLIRTLAQAAGVQSEIVPVEARNGAPAPPTAAPRMLEARAESILKAEGVPALRFEVSDVEDPVEVGKEAMYEIRVFNQGTGPCTNVQIVAELSESTQAVGTTGPTTGRSDARQIVFEPIAMFQVKGEAVYRVRVKGTQPGDFRFRVRLTCDQIRTPTIKEENTRFFKE